MFLSIDIKPVNEKLELTPNVKLWEKDVFSLNSYEDLDCMKPFDVVLSDMAPNTTGIRDVDQIRSLELVEKIIRILPIILKPGGNTVIKIFDSHDAPRVFKIHKKPIL